MRFKKKVKGKYKVVKNGRFIKLAAFSIIILAIFSIVGLSCANCCWMTANLASLWGGVLSAAATIILGIVAVWQNIEYKRQSDITQDKLFKAQVFSSCPYFSINSCDINYSEDSGFKIDIVVKNIGKTFAPWVMVTQLELSKSCFLLNKADNYAYSEIYENEYFNLKPEDFFIFHSDNINITLEEGKTYYLHLVLSVVSDSQVQFDQQITLKYEAKNDKLKCVGQAVSKFLELYNI